MLRSALDQGTRGIICHYFLHQWCEPFSGPDHTVLCHSSKRDQASAGLRARHFQGVNVFGAHLVWAGGVCLEAPTVSLLNACATPKCLCSRTGRDRWGQVTHLRAAASSLRRLMCSAWGQGTSPPDETGDAVHHVKLGTSVSPFPAESLQNHSAKPVSPLSCVPSGC